MYYSSQRIYQINTNTSFFFLCVGGLCLVLILTFSSLNLLSFYFYFEASLIPTFLIILGWGYQPERLQAGIYFLFYTLTASLPLLMSLVFLDYRLGGLDLLTIGSIFYGREYTIIFWGLTLAFLVKMPIFFTHL